MERRSGILRNPKHADSSSALNMMQQLKGSAGGSSSGSGSGSRASSTHPMSASNPVANSNNGGSIPVSSTLANRSSGSSRKKKQKTYFRQQDQYMPVANVVRIMRRVMPPHAKISDDAKETIQECVSEFISFVTGEANDKCQREQRKTVTAEDLISAMETLGFDDYLPSLSLYLSRYREQDQTHQRNTGPTETYAPVPPVPPLLPPMVASDNSHFLDFGPGRNQHGMNMMTLPQDLPGPPMPNYGPGLGFQLGPNNPGMFDSMGLSGFFGNTPGAGPAGGSSSQNAGSSYDPFAQFFK